MEHGTFTLLVFSLTGGIGPETSMFHKHIAQKIANKTDEKYEKVQTLIRCKLSFLILRSVLLCIPEACFILYIAIFLLGMSHFEIQLPVFYSDQAYLAFLYWLSWFFFDIFCFILFYFFLFLLFFFNQPCSSQFAICQLPFLNFLLFWNVHAHKIMIYFICLYVNSNIIQFLGFNVLFSSCTCNLLAIEILYQV